jgi:16S rRNA (cytidine1402-2'-O)-methyltransferase
MAKDKKSGKKGELPNRTGDVLADELAKPLVPGLYLVSTPIGNLADITLRALAVLSGADLVYCEDTRHSRKLFSHFDIKRDLAAYHEHNAARERPRILERVASGSSVALISDAGTPLVSDPGFKLVREAQDAGLAVHAVPGPSALLAGLVSSGLPSDRFFFEGFLPPKQTARRKRIKVLAVVPATLILFETAKRIEAVLADLAAELGDRQAAIAKELTKKHETIARAPLDDLASLVAGWPDETRKGELVVIVEAAAEQIVSDAAIEARLKARLASFSVRDATRAVAAEFGVPRGKVYKIALALANEAKPARGP